MPGITPVPVTAWRLVYATVDPFGFPTQASALVVTPEVGEGAVPLVSYQHGTVTRRADVPSRLNDEADLGLILAAARYLVVMPDYLGLGDSPGRHPYHHAGSQATAVVDALRPDVVAALRADPDHPIRLALRDNDLHTGWVPAVPTRLYHCAGDRDVLPLNTQVALAHFQAAGATQVTAVDPFPLANHSFCAALALLQAKQWFDSLRIEP
ncbi:MAG: hypothetical protein KF833_15230 [Verrucomicrobiae bacterium]|nr:hypothetical protein [Verrucomicrobiae bacterium]